MTASSASDDGAYPIFCAAAAEDQGVFATFRRNPVYRQILEHFSHEDGLTFLWGIKEHAPQLLDKVGRFRANDAHGGPEVYEYGELGVLSPSTLRYVCHLANILAHFPDLTGANIVEVGGGYGGLCSVILNHANVESYTLVDLPQAMLLADRWLTVTLSPEQRDKVSFWNVLSSDPPPQQAFDLLISNFAFTECTPAVQDAYLDGIVSLSKAGFILYNLRPESHHPAVLLSKLQKRVPAAVKCFPETPQTCPTNFLLVYGGAREAEGDPPPYAAQRLLYGVSPTLWSSAKSVSLVLRQITRALVALRWT